MFKVGAIGAGHMGMAVLDAFAKHGAIDPNNILVYDINNERMEDAKKRGFALGECESSVYANCQMLLLGVRPQSCAELFGKIGGKSKANDPANNNPAHNNSPIIISIMAGIDSIYIRNKLQNDQIPVVTIMPTLGMMSGNGAAAIAHTQNVPEDDLSYIIKIFSATGEAVIVDEPQLNEIVAVNGCMPGYVFYLLDAFAKGAQKQGVGYQMAVRMAARGFMGAAAQVLENKIGPEELMATVCTPGGLTAQGVEYFKQNKLDEILSEGMAESIRRGYELGGVRKNEQDKE